MLGQMFDLKTFRKANHLTQNELAAFFGVGQGFISQIEKGDRPIPPEYISRILANPCRWDTSMLTTESRDEVEEVRANDKSMPERLLDIIEGQKQQIETLLEMLKEKDEEINRLRAELDARKGGTASDAPAFSCANVG